jgi:hypothetical protein
MSLLGQEQGKAKFLNYSESPNFLRREDRERILTELTEFFGQGNAEEDFAQRTEEEEG